MKLRSKMPLAIFAGVTASLCDLGVISCLRNPARCCNINSWRIVPSSTSLSVDEQTPRNTVMPSTSESRLLSASHFSRQLLTMSLPHLRPKWMYRFIVSALSLPGLTPSSFSTLSKRSPTSAPSVKRPSSSIIWTRSAYTQTLRRPLRPSTDRRLSSFSQSFSVAVNDLDPVPLYLNSKVRSANASDTCGILHQ